MPAATLRQVVDAQAAGRDAIRRRVAAEVDRLIDPFDAWDNDRLVLDLADELYASVATGQRQTAAMTDAYLARATTILADRSTTASGTLRPGDYPLRGVPGPEVYARLAGTYRYAKSRGADAQHITRFRADAMLQADLQHAGVRQARKFYRDKKIAEYRRVIHPEIAKGGTCGLCYAASDRHYKASQLMPVHERCSCETLPIVGGRDPIALDVDLAEAYDLAGTTLGADLKKVRVVTHSELGPQLRVKGHHHRTAATAAADKEHTL